MRNGLIWLILSVGILLVDRYTKMWMAEHLLLGEPMEIFSFLSFTLAYNTGAAFSFLHDASGWQQYLLGGLACVVTVSIIIWLSRTPRSAYWQNISLSLILAGALGNAWDRVNYGHVVDFISFHLGYWHFAIFNVADAAICVGAAMLILMWLKQDHA